MLEGSGQAHTAQGKDLFERFHDDERTMLLRSVQSIGLDPFFGAVEPLSGGHARVRGKQCLMLGSGNYLGLASDPRIVEAASSALRLYGTGVAGSRLTNGTLDLHEQLEQELADWLGVEAAMLFPTGYQTNLGCLAGLLTPEDTAVLDASAHASIVDGCSMAGARVRRYRHNRVDKLAAVLEQSGRYDGATLVVTEGVFSMEGDVALLDEIADLTRRSDARLMVDEAHALGILGSRGAGASELFDAEQSVDIRMGTFSKSLATVGGFIAGGSDMIEFLRVNSNPFVFSAASTPADSAATLAAVQICRSDEGAELRKQLLVNAGLLRHGLTGAGCPVAGAPDSIPTPIVPIEMTDTVVAARAWQQLLESGVYCNLAVYPAVAPDKPLLRFCVSAGHQRADIEGAVDKITAALEVANSADVAAR